VSWADAVGDDPVAAGRTRELASLGSAEY